MGTLGMDSVAWRFTFLVMFVSDWVHRIYSGKTIPIVTVRPRPSWRRVG